MTKETALAVVSYLTAAALVAAVVMGKLDPELAAVIAGTLALPSPLQHALGALRAPVVAADADPNQEDPAKQDHPADQP